MSSGRPSGGGAPGGGPTGVGNGGGQGREAGARPSRRVVIIGGGITGTLSAVRLAREGWEVVLLEGAHVGAGSSSRTAAGIRQQFSTPETVLGMRYAVDVYRRFPEEVGGMISPIVENGYLFLFDDAAGEAAARARVQVQRSVGLDEVELLGADALAARFPFVDPGAVRGGTFCPSDGFLRPEVVYGEAAASARARGVDLRQRAPVDAARAAGGRLLAVRAGGEWVEGDAFIDATNAWSPRLARVLGATALPVAPQKRYLWFLLSGGAMPTHELIRMPMVVTPGGAYCHPENGEVLMTGWAHAAPDEPDFGYADQDRIEPDFDHRAGADGRGAQTWAALAGFMPVVGEFAGLHATTCGYYGVTPDHNPFLGYDPQLSNLVRAVGFSGHGAMFGPFTAHVLAHLLDAGRDLDRVPVLGHAAELAPFQIGRAFHAAEHLVI